MVGYFDKKSATGEQIYYNRNIPFSYLNLEMTKQVILLIVSSHQWLDYDPCERPQN